MEVMIFCILIPNNKFRPILVMIDEEEDDNAVLGPLHMRRHPHLSNIKGNFI